jgi:hypothetical protein
MKTSGITFSIIVIILLFSGIQYAVAQQQEKGLKETLQDLSEDVAKQYVSPLSSAFGANLNSGWFHRPPGAKIFGLKFEIGVVMMASIFPEGRRSFNTAAHFRFNEQEAMKLVSMAENDINSYVDNYVETTFPTAPDPYKTEIKNHIAQEIENNMLEQITADYQNVEASGATIIGSQEDSIKIKFTGQDVPCTVEGSYEGYNYSLEHTFNVPDQTIVMPIAGFKEELGGAKWMPFIVPQLKVGTVLGTQLTFRFKIPVKNEAYDEYMHYFGFGIQHNPALWLGEKLPFEMALSFFTQKLTVGDIFEVNTHSFGLNISKQLGWRFLNLTPYMGYMYENAKMKVTYEYIIETPIDTYSEPIEFELISENKSRFTLGMNVRFAIFNLNLDYSWAKYNSLSAGLNLAI